MSRSKKSKPTRSSGSKRSNSTSRSGSKSRKARVISRVNANIPDIDRALNVIYNENMENLDVDNECIDINFLHNYPKNMARIREALKESGKYKINKGNVEKFINEQLTPIRRQAAKDLIDSTIYIKLKDTMKIVEQLIHQIYQRYAAIGEIRKPYIYCGPPNKSFYFFSVIALHYIKKHGYQIPSFLKEMSDDFMRNFDAPLIIIDDASYSGAQLAGLLGNLFYYRYINGMPHLHITAALTALNTISLRKLSEVPTKKSFFMRREVDMVFAPTPFEIMCLPERIYTSLPIEIGLERYFNINLFFNAILSSDTNIALYLDHKVADSTSTYKNVYVYGPIVPDNYDITHSRDYELCKVCFFPNFTDQVRDGLIRDFIQDNPAFLQTVPNPFPYTAQTGRAISYFLHNKVIQRDIIDKPRYKRGIQFHPFIQKCSNSSELKEIIHNPDIINMQYLIFMHDVVKSIDNLLGAMDGYTNEGYKDKSLQAAEDVKNQSIIDKNLRLVELLESHRCPSPFYKTGLLKLI